MPKVTDAYLKARRDQITEAALRCFARNGYHRTTMKDIAHEAGVSYGVAYHYFRGKEDILAAASTEGLERRAHRFEEAVRPASARRALSETLRVNLERWSREENEAEIRLRVLLLAEAVRSHRIRTLFEEGYGDYVERYSTLVRQGQERGEIDASLDATAVAQVFVALHDGLLVLKVARPETGVEQYMTAALALIERGIGQRSEQEGGDGDNGNGIPR